MNAQEIINYIATAPKKTPVKAYVRVREGAELDLSYAEHVFGLGSREKVVFADWAKLGPVLAAAGAVVVEDVPAGRRRRRRSRPRHQAGRRRGRGQDRPRRRPPLPLALPGRWGRC